MLGTESLTQYRPVLARSFCSFDGRANPCLASTPVSVRTNRGRQDRLRSFASAVGRRPEGTARRPVRPRARCAEFSASPPYRCAAPGYATNRILSARASRPDYHLNDMTLQVGGEIADPKCR